MAASSDTVRMRLFVGIPWWLALPLAVVLAPYLIVAGLVKLALEIQDDLRRGRV